MLDEAKLILMVPAALKAAVDLFDRFRRGGQMDAEEGKHLLEDVINNLGEFAHSADELEAWKAVHTMTNRLQADLPDLLALATSRKTDVATEAPNQKKNLLQELDTLERTGGAGDQLAKLRKRPRQMRFLNNMPRGICDIIKEQGKTWDAFLAESFENARRDLELDNYGSFADRVRKIARMRQALSNHSDFQIEEWTRQYNQLMIELRSKINS